MNSTEHSIKFGGCSPHNGEYWHSCQSCGASDWIANYGTLDQLDFFSKPCISSPPKDEPK